MEKLGGIKLSCGCFLAANVNDMRILLVRVGPSEVMSVIEGLEVWHDCKAK